MAEVEPSRLLTAGNLALLIAARMRRESLVRNSVRRTRYRTWYGALGGALAGQLMDLAAGTLQFQVLR